MKRKIFVPLLLLVSLFLSSCGDILPGTIEHKSVDCPYTVDGITYSTVDGTWTDETVDQMIDRYYQEEKRNIDLTIEVTFTVNEDFQYAYIFSRGGVLEEGEMHRIVTYSYSSEHLGDSDWTKGAVRAGTYTITMTERFSFYYAERFMGVDVPVERDEIDLTTKLYVKKDIVEERDFWGNLK